jgi:hypothetical protein
MGEEIDRLSAALAAKRIQFDAKSKMCESELAAGRTGLDAWHAANALLKEMQALAATLKLKIEEAIRGLGE